jgi:hypothetical protein
MISFFSRPYDYGLSISSKVAPAYKNRSLYHLNSPLCIP